MQEKTRKREKRFWNCTTKGTSYIIKGVNYLKKERKKKKIQKEKIE
tara:strand:- start:225 stop:362 length:138 start_codon:yes stop_codon:yes gene_type:complete